MIKDTFHPVLFFGTLSFFIAVYGIFANGDSTQRFVAADDVIFYLTIVLLAFAGFVAGWIWAIRRERRSPEAIPAPSAYRPSLLFVWSLLFTGVGVTAAMFTRNDFTVTGYVRDFGTLWIVGALLAIQSALLLPTLRVAAIAVVAVCLIPPIDRFLSYGQRGDTFRIAMLVIPFFLFYRRRPPRGIFIPCALLLAVVLATLVQTRTLVGRGEARNRIDALTKVIPSFFDGVNRKPSQGADEYIFGTAMVATARQTGVYDNGVGFLYNTAVRFLPKEYFDKDPLYTRWAIVNYIPYVSGYAGYAIPGGAAPSGFAHAFVEFWWFFPLFWMFYGFVSRRIYLRSLTGDLAQQGYFVAYFVITLYLVAQDLYPFTMQILYTIPALWLAYRTARAPQAHAEHQPFDLQQPSIAEFVPT
ncbi:MAG TPA: hypothetical protein VH253_20425 [Phycisphaerae bacterium]|nr:hypothetical protein [Phycisphaerae bacterium]